MTHTGRSRFIRTVLGDREELPAGAIYAHEHLIIDSTLVADRFPAIHLHDTNDSVAEVTTCREAGVALMVDAMPISSGRDAARLAEISRRTAVDIITATGLHHDRYYGPLHWTNRVGADELTALFVDDLVTGVDEFDYTGPIVRRTPYRAGVIKVATGGPEPDARDRRNLTAAAQASLTTGAPILTHCEGGWGGIAQIDLLAREGIDPRRVILSHVDKPHDLPYLQNLADTGAVLELDQGLREHDRGTNSVTVQAIVHLLEQGHEKQIVVGTDGARRDLWSVLGGSPGLAWLAAKLPLLLREVGVTPAAIGNIMRDNALRSLSWQLSR